MQLRPDIVAVMVGVAVEGPYTYHVPDGMTVARGSIVSVPLGPRLVLGVVWGPPKDMVAHNRLRDIAMAYDVPPLSEELLKLVEWVARYTLAGVAGRLAFERSTGRAQAGGGVSPDRQGSRQDDPGPIAGAGRVDGRYGLAQGRVDRLGWRLGFGR